MNARVMHRVKLAGFSPSLLALAPDKQDEVLARMAEAASIDDFSAEDREFVIDGGYAIATGKTSLTSPLEWGDWVKLDAAEDDASLLDDALDTVGRGYDLLAVDGDWTRLPAPGEPVPDPEFTDDEGDLLDPDDLPDDDDGWVGM